VFHNKFYQKLNLKKNCIRENTGISRGLSVSIAICLKRFIGAPFSVESCLVWAFVICV
jgi:hypothetical protein